MEDVKVLNWTKRTGYSYGYSNGSGYGNGDGSGDGSGSGSGSGYGYGNGSGYGNGNGSGDGSGNGNGSGYGYGYGDGYGSGNGYGNGSGDCYGYGSGNGYVKSFNGNIVYVIDSIPTIISEIKGNLAKGFILKGDFTLTPCYVTKNDKYFAHGETLKEAREALQIKIFENMDTEETIEKFLSTFEKEKKYPVKDFYDWHHYLTGSCEMGRKAFMQDRNITFDDTFTVDEFIELCENSYGGDVIKELKEWWEIK